MFDTVAARRMMVDGQVRTADVTDLDLIGAMLTVPRERFVPAALAEQAYCDGDIALGGGRVLLKPMVLAKLIQAARVGAERYRARCRLRAPVIRRPCWPALPARWWRWSRTRRWRRKPRLRWRRSAPERLRSRPHR